MSLRKRINLVIGWAWAANCALSVCVYSITEESLEAWLAVFFFGLAVLYWNRDMQRIG